MKLLYLAFICDKQILVTLTYIRILSEKKKDQWVIWTKPLGRLENYPTFWLWRTRLIVIFYKFYECVHWSKSDKKQQWFSNKSYTIFSHFFFKSIFFVRHWIFNIFLEYWILGSNDTVEYHNKTIYCTWLIHWTFLIFMNIIYFILNSPSRNKTVF